MHGLICKAVEGFVRDQHGAPAWATVRTRASLPFDSFEALRIYDPELVEGVLDGCADVLGCERDALFEDVGHWVCVHPPLEPIRRLFRFSGATFVNVLYALDEVHDRACMALPGLQLPRWRLADAGTEDFRITSRWNVAGGGAFLIGALRAMADDYGTLVMIEAGAARRDGAIWHETINVRVVVDAYQEPREFTLGGVA